MDGVKIIADGIRLEKKMVKTGAKGKRQTRRSASHDVTNIKKDDADIIINATSNDNEQNENTDEMSENEDSSANRTNDENKGDKD